MNFGTRKTLVTLALILLARAADAQGSGSPPWQEGFTVRLEALALLQTLNADLLSHDSATLTLDRWCAAHRLASPARIVAERVHGAEQAPTTPEAFTALVKNEIAKWGKVIKTANIKPE